MEIIIYKIFTASDPTNFSLKRKFTLVHLQNKNQNFGVSLTSIKRSGCLKKMWCTTWLWQVFHTGLFQNSSRVLNAFVSTCLLITYSSFKLTVNKASLGWISRRARVPSLNGYAILPSMTRLASIQRDLTKNVFAKPRDSKPFGLGQTPTQICSRME